MVNPQFFYPRHPVLSPRPPVYLSSADPPFIPPSAFYPPICLLCPDLPFISRSAFYLYIRLLSPDPPVISRSAFIPDVPFIPRSAFYLPICLLSPHPYSYPPPFITTPCQPFWVTAKLIEKKGTLFPLRHKRKLIKTVPFSSFANKCKRSLMWPFFAVCEASFICRKALINQALTLQTSLILTKRVTNQRIIVDKHWKK